MGLIQRIAGRIMLLDGWRRALTAFLAGVLATFALAPYYVLAVGFVSFPILVWLLDGAAGEPGRGFLRRLLPAFTVGWCFGFGYFVGGLWWLGAAMLVDAENFLWAIPFAVLGLPAVVAIYHGLAAMLARAFWSDGGARIFALAASFAVFEYLRGLLFTGFPWNEIGMMAAPLPILMQSAALVGLHGLTLMAVLVFAAPALIAGGSSLRRPAVAAAVLLVIGHVGYGAARLAGNDAGMVAGVELRLVQPNVNQAQKWEPEEAERIFSGLLELSAAPAAGVAEGGRTLIVWPETAFPFILTERPDAVARLAETLRPGETLLAGATRMEETGQPTGPRYYNSVIAVDEAGTIVAGRDKRHLVPFGEYLPFQETLEGFGLQQLATLPGGFSAGAPRTPIDLGGGVSALPLVCYEIIFQDEIDLSGDEPRPGFLLNVTNDAWYGQTPGPHQHLRHAQLTAAAFGLPLVRAANSGISVVTDAKGREVAGLGLGERGTVVAGLPAAGEPTVFSRFGNLPFAAALIAAALVAAGASTLSRQRD